MKQYKLTDEAVQSIVDKATRKLSGMKFICPVNQYQVLETFYLPRQSDLELIPEQFKPGDLVIFRGDVRIVENIELDGSVKLGQIQKDRFITHTVCPNSLQKTDYVAQTQRSDR